MQRGVFGFCRRYLMLRPDDLILASGHLRHRTFQLRLQFRNFQHRECLPLADPVADIHPDGPNEAGNLGMNVDHLVRLELPRKRQDVGDRTPLDDRHLRSRRLWSSFDRPVRMRAEDKPCGQSEDGARSHRENETLSHIVYAPIDNFRKHQPSLG